MTLDRAIELQRKMWASGGLPSAEVKAIPEETPAERAEIHAMWQRMPGHTCRVDAINRIVRTLRGEA